MKKVIIWNEWAMSDYHSNIEYLLEYWSDNEAMEFITSVENIVSNLSNGNVGFKLSKYENIKQCVVCRQITLFYRDINLNSIELLRFWNTYQDNNRINFSG